MSLPLNIKFEKAVRFLVKYFPVSDENSRKPVLFHDIRVGVYLYENGYGEDIVLSGLLHDAVEWSGADAQKIREEFGDNVAEIVLANTKDDLTKDSKEKINELIKRCVECGEDALIVKTADIIDSFKWYSSQNNKDELEYCMRNANAILKFKREDFHDKVFEELGVWREKFAHLGV